VLIMVPSKFHRRIKGLSRDFNSNQGIMTGFRGDEVKIDSLIILFVY